LFESKLTGEKFMQVGSVGLTQQRVLSLQVRSSLGYDSPVAMKKVSFRMDPRASFVTGPNGLPLQRSDRTFEIQVPVNSPDVLNGVKQLLRGFFIQFTDPRETVH